jgi:hypothetical protein
LPARRGVRNERLAVVAVLAVLASTALPVRADEGGDELEVLLDNEALSELTAMALVQAMGSPEDPTVYDRCPPPDEAMPPFATHTYKTFIPAIGVPQAPIQLDEYHPNTPWARPGTRSWSWSTGADGGGAAGGPSKRWPGRRSGGCKASPSPSTSSS